MLQVSRGLLVLEVVRLRVNLMLQDNRCLLTTAWAAIFADAASVFYADNPTDAASVGDVDARCGENDAMDNYCACDLCRRYPFETLWIFW